MSEQHLEQREIPSSEPLNAAHRDVGPVRKCSERLLWLSAFLFAVAVLHNGWEAYQYRQRFRAVRCDEPVFDFGNALTGDTIDHLFEVTNVSRADLQIERVQASCGCTTVATELEGVVIGPGQSFDVPVQLRLSGSEEGRFERAVLIRFAGEPTLELKLKLTGNVAPRWSWSTSMLVFDGIHQDETASRTIELSRHVDAPQQELTQIVATPAGLFETEFEDVSPAGDQRTWRVRVTTVPPLREGRQEAALYAFTSPPSDLIHPVRVVLIVRE